MTKVTAFWEKSKSANVVKQVLKYVWTDAEVVTVELGPDVESFDIDNVPSPTSVSVFLSAHSEFKSSDEVSATLVVPDLSVPEAPTNLSLKLAE